MNIEIGRVYWVKLSHESTRVLVLSESDELTKSWLCETDEAEVVICYSDQFISRESAEQSRIELSE